MGVTRSPRSGDLCGQHQEETSDDVMRKHRGPQRAPSPELTREIKRWRRELTSMWRAWMPRRSSMVWKLLALSAVMSALQYIAHLPLTLTQDSLRARHLWVVLTTGWVERPSSPLFVILILGVIAAMKSGALAGELRRPRYFGYAIAVFFALIIVNLVLPGVTWSLISEGVMLIWFGADIERRLGARHLFILSILTLTISYAVGAFSVAFISGDFASGMRPLTRGLIIAWGYLQGRALLPLLNLRGDQLRWVVYAFSGFEILLYPAPLGLVSLAGAGVIDLWSRRYLVKS